MSETDRIWDQLQRTFEGGDAWRCPSLRDLLATVSAPQAAARPIAGAPTIWELLLHATVYESVARRRLEGEHVETLPDELGWPRARRHARPRRGSRPSSTSARPGGRCGRRSRPSRRPGLGETVPGREYTFYVMLHGVDRARPLPRGPDRDAHGRAGRPAVGRADVDAPEPPLTVAPRLRVAGSA